MFVAYLEFFFLRGKKVWTDILVTVKNIEISSFFFFLDCFLHIQ